MNKLTIIGNLTRDPESRTTPNGNNVCTFTVAVNRRRSQNSNQPEADFFRVSVFGVVGENCQRYLAKGRKVAVVGSCPPGRMMAQLIRPPLPLPSLPLRRIMALRKWTTKIFHSDNRPAFSRLKISKGGIAHV